MKEIKEYSTLKSQAETYLDDIRKSIEEAERIYNNQLPTEKQNKMQTVSKYLVSDYAAAIDTYAENLLQRFPNLDLESSKELLEQDTVDDINKIVARISATNGLYKKLWHIAHTGLRKRVCAFEVVPKTITKSGYKIIDGQMQEYTYKYKGNIDIIKYETENVLIDPNANPDNPIETADYVIVELGLFSENTFMAMAQENGWDVDIKKIRTQLSNTGMRIDMKQYNGISNTEGVLVDKMFKRDGTVEVVVNNNWVVSSKINSKLVKRMPLNLYISLGGGLTAYNRSIFENMKHAIYGKSAILNLMLDNVGKTLKSPTFTTSAQLAGKNLNDFQKDSLVHFPHHHDGPLKNEFHRLEFPDMTQGSILAFNQFSQDLTKATRINSLEQGFQEKNVRTNLIARQLASGTIERTSAILKQAEDTLFAPFGRDLMDIFYAYYDDFSELAGIDRDIFADIKTVRIRNGSSLEQDKESQLQRLVTMLQTVLGIAEDSYDVDKILDEIFSQMGFNDPDRYKLRSDEAMQQFIMKNGISGEVAAQITPIVMNTISQAAQQATGGGQ